MKIVCLCDNIIDDYINTGEMFPGGQAVNVSAHAAILGYKSYYLGRIASDKYGKVILDSLNEVNVDTSYAEVVPDSTSRLCQYNVVDGEKSYLGVVAKDNWAGMVDYKEIPEIMRTADIVHCSVNSKIPEQVQKWTNLEGVFVYDFGEKDKYHTDEYLSMVGPRIDLALFSVEPLDEKKAKEFCDRMHKYGIKHIVLTMGSKGQYFSNGTDLIHNDIKKVDAIDTMGAGDAFITACMISLREDGWQKGQIILDKEVIKRAMNKGSEYAALNCMKPGAFGIKVNY